MPREQRATTGTSQPDRHDEMKKCRWKTDHPMSPYIHADPDTASPEW
jgi:hypothetical protein